MSWFESFGLVMRSSVTTLRERVEDPERMLHQLLIDMQAELDHVRGRVAESIADEIQLKRRSDRQVELAASWQKRAGEALRRGDDRAAAAAMTEKITADELSKQFADDHAQHSVEVARLERSTRELESKIAAAKHKKTILAAKMAQATSKQRIHRAISGSSIDSATAQFERFEDRVERQEALSKAHDRLNGRDPSVDDLAAEFAAQERQDRVKEELQRLKESL